MLHAHTVVPAGTWSGEPADSVVLDFDERYRRRFAMTGVRGLKFLLDLNEATMLRGGDGLKLDDGRIVEVVAAPEPLTEIRASDAATLYLVDGPSIVAQPTSGGTPTTIVDSGDAFINAAASQGEVVYWANPTTVYSASTSGMTPAPIVVASSLTGIRSLAADDAYLYIGTQNGLLAVPSDGTGETPTWVIASVAPQNVSQVAVDADAIYWADGTGLMRIPKALVISTR